MRTVLALFALLCVLCSGCANTRLYPVCFYDEKPASDQIADVYLPRLEKVLRMELGDASRVEIVSTADARWLVARTTEDENRRLADFWPRVGCIGTAYGPDGVTRESHCVSYLSAFVADQRYLALGTYTAGGKVALKNEAPDPTILVYCDGRR